MSSPLAALGCDGCAVPQAHASWPRTQVRSSSQTRPPASARTDRHAGHVAVRVRVVAAVLATERERACVALRTARGRTRALRWERWPRQPKCQHFATYRKHLAAQGPAIALALERHANTHCCQEGKFAGPHPAPRQGLAHGICEQLQQFIYCGDIAPGERLNEAALALRMGTSRGPIREAIRMLTRHRPGRGGAQSRRLCARDLGARDAGDL